jgi:hypothetical protein
MSNFIFYENNEKIARCETREFKNPALLSFKSDALIILNFIIPITDLSPYALPFLVIYISQTP